MKLFLLPLLWLATTANAAMLTWDPVTTYDDGVTPLVNPKYILYCGPEPGDYTYRSPEITRTYYRFMLGGTWHCTVTAFDGIFESKFSNEVQAKNLRPNDPVITVR